MRKIPTRPSISPLPIPSLATLCLTMLTLGLPLGIIACEKSKQPENQLAEQFKAKAPAGKLTFFPISDGYMSLVGVSVQLLSQDWDDPNTLWAGTEEGVYLSTDGGDSWKQSVGLVPARVYSLTQSSADPKVLWAGGCRDVYLSTDGGINWAKATGLGNASVTSLTQSSADPKVLWVGTSRGAYFSTDDGRVWGPRMQGLPEDLTLFALQQSKDEDRLYI